MTSHLDDGSDRMNSESFQINGFSFTQFPPHFLDVAMISRFAENVDGLDAHVAQMAEERLKWE